MSMTTNSKSSLNEKTVLRKRLEEIQDEVYQSWLKDTDKVSELIELSNILEEILQKSSIEEQFENQSDFDYFFRKFTTETLANILRQVFIYGPNGDDVALNVILLYLKIFIKFMDKPQYSPLWESMKEIFDFTKSYYKGSMYSTNRLHNEKKMLTAEQYNEKFLQRKPEAQIEVSEGMEIDILVNNSRQTSINNPERRVWIRGKVAQLNQDHFLAYTCEDSFPVYLKYNSFDFAPKGTMTKDWDWRLNLQPFENVDGYDRQRWYPSTVVMRKEDIVNGMKRVEYRVSFKLYTSLVPNWKEFRHFWPDKELSRDMQGREYFGDIDNFDEWFPFYSKRMQPFLSITQADSNRVDPFENESYFIDDMVKFISDDGKKNYVVGRSSHFSYYFTQVLIYLAESNALEKMISSLSLKGDNRPTPDLVNIIFNILNSASIFLHKDYIIEIGKNLYNNILHYVNEMNQNELRNIKKEAIELITKVLRFYLGLTLDSDQRNEVIEKFSISFAIKMIKTSFLDKRVTAVKTIIDIIKSSRQSPEKRDRVLKLIEENQIFNEIYGPNSHVQLMNKSKDLLEIILQENKLSDGEIEMIWNGTKKGDLEGKLTILRTLKEISRYLRPSHIKVLLENVYSSKGSELLNDEIDLIHDLSTLSGEDNALERCIRFFTQCLLESQNEEGERVTILINKIFDITKLHPNFKSFVIKMTLDSLEKNENVILALKILQKYIKEAEKDYDIEQLLIQNNTLVNLFLENFAKYLKYVKEKAKTWTKDIDQLPLRDHFKHSQNIKSRLNFINCLLELKLWRIEEDPIDFVYKNLVEDGYIAEKDKEAFYWWIKTVIESNLDYNTQEKIFRLFNEKICKDSKACINLSIEAFDTYLKVFLDINARLGNLKYNRDSENSFELEVKVEPDELIGFSILWKIVFESYSTDIMNKGIEILHMLFTNVNINTPTEGYTQVLIRKCIDLIKTTIDDKEQTEQGKRNIVTKCLLVLRLMIEESEKRGTAGVISHQGLLKRKIITFKIASSVGANRNFAVKLYGNTTIWDLKRIISLKLQYHSDFLQIGIPIGKEYYELKVTDNGKTIMDMGIENGCELKVLPNGFEKKIPYSDIDIDGKIVPELVEIFNSWFTEYSTDDKMTKEDCARFVKAVTGGKEEITVEDQRVTDLFRERDKNKDGLIEREDFVQFYIDAVKPDKRKLVWDNLRCMGIRNDLKKISEPIFSCNTDKLSLPRYQLTNNEEFFNVIFYLQDLNEEIAKEAFKFLCVISTNPKIYNQILHAEGQADWDTLLSDSNIYKLIYSLQIIESFIEDIEINSTNVDNLLLDSDEKSMDKTEWMKNFVEKSGFTHLVSILNRKLNLFVDSIKQENKANSMMNNICLEFLLKIIKIFYVTSLSKFESYKKIMQELNKNEDDMNSLKKAKSFNQNQLEDCFSSGGLSENILNAIDHNALVSNFISLISLLINRSKTKEEIGIINTALEFTCVMIPHSPNYEIVEKSLTENKFFVDIALYGLLNDDEYTRSLFSNSLIKMSKMLKQATRYGLIVLLFKNIFDLIDNLQKEHEKNSNHLFEFFSHLLEMYIESPTKFSAVTIDSNKFLNKILDAINTDINEDSNDPISNELFLGYIKIISKVAENNKDLKRQISNNYNLIQGILTKVLFKQNADELSERLAKCEFVNPDKINDSKTNRNANVQIRNICYTFILSMLKDSIENFEKFFSVNVLDSDKEKEDEKKKESKYFYTSYYGRNEEHVGLKNLGCICYMNAALQQFFMVPSLRYSLLRVTDGVESNTNNVCNVDDNILHQAQRMFSFLELSERMDYNPFGFCYSFKDFDGRPVNLGEQKDSQEFLSIFLDRIENKLRATASKYTLQSIFGGKTCSQVVCQNCGNTSNSFEDFCNLSVEVRNMKTLYDSLDKLISFENIDEYNCDGCKKKVSITKRNSLASLPNVLIVHLQRIYFNWETDRNEKINSRLEFPKVLNLKQYCLEEILRKTASAKAKEGETDLNTETDEIYFKGQSYYDYYLVGVVVHQGVAEAGHYYSYINTVRGGEGNEAYYNSNDEMHVNSWLEFNDSFISKFNINRLEDECFGGTYDNDKGGLGWNSWSRGEKSKSAYMLVYERRIKTPLKVVIQPQTENLVTFKAEEKSKVLKEYDLMRYVGNSEFTQMQNKINSTAFYDVSNNEYFKLEPFYINEKLVPKSYYLEIVNDNSNFQKHQNISDEKFANFFDQVINLLDETIKNLKEISQDTALKISMTFMNFIMNILSKKDKHQLLKQAKDKFIHIVSTQPTCLIPVWNYISQNLKQLSEVLFNENEVIVSANCEMLTELIGMVYRSSPEDFVHAANQQEYQDNLYSQCVKTVDFILSHFPRVSGRFLTKTGPIMKMLREISLVHDDILRYLVSREIVFTFITYFIGRDSPCYLDTLVKPNENWDYGMRQFISGSEPMVELIYDLFKRKSDSSITLSIRDEKCMKSSSFLKHVFKASPRIFSEMLVTLNKDDYEFTLQSCGEITHSIEEINCYTDSNELVKLTESLIPLLNLKDSYQRMRFEILLGLPQITIDDSLRYPFPLVGYHLLSDKKGKYMTHKSTSNVRFSCSLIKKLFEFGNRSSATVKVFLLLLEACAENDELLKYIRKIPAEEPRLSDFVEWGVVLVNEYGKTDENPYKVQLKGIVKDKINTKLGTVLTNQSILPGFNGFNGKYLIKDIKREEISLLIQKDNLYVFMVEYFANTIPITDNIDFSNSKSNYTSLEEKKEPMQTIDETENLSTIPEDTVLLNSDIKINISEREFYKHILVHFTSHKKVVVQSKFSVPGYKSVLKRFIILNNSTRDANIEFRLLRMSSVVEAVNEYVPVSPICLLAPSNLLRNLYLMTKVNENAEWTDANNFDYQLTYEFVTYRTMGNYGSVSNAPVYMNFTPSANYAVNSSNYTGTDPDGQISESLEDDDDEYGSRP